MVWSVIADGAFALTVLIETLAALSLLSIFHRVRLRDELDPLLEFYHAHVWPIVALPAKLVPAALPEWFNDAYAISLAFFFLFFILQLRRASAPHEAGDQPPPADSPALGESALDAALPLIFCGIGAIVIGLTLLPLLTPAIALCLLARELAGKPSWFKVSRSYYANLVFVGGLTAAILALPR